MYFKGIQMAGFKSFADKVEIKFDNGITAIVGPNGCGKSNVGDAIKWVLGEQSAKDLRGKSMQDVIFNGTEKRKSLSYCEVSLYFNNTERIFNLECDDIVVTRKLYRNGESVYLINHQQCRLKDILNLFFDSGIGRDGYSIISQGKVEQIISSKPEDRRLIFEEAAGIAKYKSQKVESERKLEKTEERLTRLRDIVAELERQLGPLKKQAETAKIYLGLRENLKDLEVNAYIYQTENVGAQKEKINARLDGILQEISLKEAELVTLNQKSNNCLEDISSVDEKMKALNAEILRLTVGIEKQAGESKLLQERINNYKFQNQKIEQEILNANNLILKNKSEQESKIARKNQLEERAHFIEQSSGEYANILKDFNNLKSLEGNLNVKINLLKNDINELYRNISVTENHRRLLVEYQQEFEGYAVAVKKLLLDAEKNVEVKDKIVGVLASLIQVQDKFETAIEVALGAAVQNIITQNEDDAKFLIAYLKNKQYGRATFLPINTMKPRLINPAFEQFLSMPGCFGVASKLFNYDKRIANVIENLLGNVVLVDNMNTAIAMARKVKFAFKIVTLEGDVINPSGSMTGGSKKSDTASLISRDRKIEELTISLNEQKIDYTEKKNLLSKLEKELYETQTKLDELDKQKNTTELKEAVEIAEIRTEIASIENDFARILLGIKDADHQIMLNQSLLKQNNDNIQIEQAKIDAILSSSINKDIQLDLEKIRNEQSNQEIGKIKLQETLRQLSAQKETVMGEINVANDKKYKEQAAIDKLTSDLENMAQRILEEYDLTYDTSLEYRKDGFDFDKAIGDIYNLKREISKLGNVNVNAIEESKEVYERYEELSVQVADLEQSKADTEQAINDLATEMSKIFSEKFNQINDNFKVTFKELFGGGDAHLELVGSDNILEAGVDIIASPPGKRLQNNSLLSGGEKALTAIAILFAILKLRSMPFCLLDEIEAALDEANVERFAQYLRRFANTTQFIVVTHRKPTMELADSLYGVTMQEKGVSRIVSVKLSEAYQNAKEGGEEVGAV